MKPWTEARNNKYLKYHSKLTYQLSFWNVSRKVDYHAGGKWFIYGPKRRKDYIVYDTLLLSLLLTYADLYCYVLLWINYNYYYSNYYYFWCYRYCYCYYYCCYYCHWNYHYYRRGDPVWYHCVTCLALETKMGQYIWQFTVLKWALLCSCACCSAEFCLLLSNTVEPLAM